MYRISMMIINLLRAKNWLIWAWSIWKDRTCLELTCMGTHFFHYNNINTTNNNRFYTKIFFLFSCRFFIDIRLYNKAKAVVEPFAFDRYRKEKIRQQIEANRPARLKVKSNLPAVNQELALKYIDADENRRSKSTNLLKDDRFKALFSNPEFEVDKNAMEYKMLTPVLSRLEKGKVKELKRKIESKMAYEEDEPAKSSDDDLFSEKDSDEEMESSDDEGKVEMQRDLKRTYRAIRKEQKATARAEDDDEEEDDDDDGGIAGNGYDRRPSGSNGAAPEYKIRNITTKQNK